MFLKRLFCLVAIAATLSSCGGGDRLIGRSDLTVSQTGDLPPPSREDLILQQRSYVVGPLDRVVVDVYGAPDLGRTVQVDANGTFSLPLLGTIEAAGKTPAELATFIEARLQQRYVRKPDVTVTVDSVGQVVTVDGQVQRPGLYPINGRMTLVRAIASAQGLTDFAATNYVVIFRQVNGKQMAALYDLRAIRQGMYADPEVFANDVVTVGESGGRRVFQAVIQSGGLLVAPLVAILN